MEGQTYRVRHIGIDTPETVHPTRGVEPNGKEASVRNRPLMEVKTVPVASFGTLPASAKTGLRPSRPL